MTLLLSFMPNSPRFLLSRGRDSEALRALAWLRGADTDIRWEFSQIQDNVQRQVREGGCEAPVVQLATGPETWRLVPGKGAGDGGSHLRERGEGEALPRPRARAPRCRCLGIQRS